jgi:predicted NUDIX family NTP pyrophosphohydrolase
MAKAAKKNSAGILPYRRVAGGSLEVLLVHPGGPFWAKKDEGAWSVTKGEFEPEEDGFAAAKREFAEETGTTVEGNFLGLKPLKQKSGKVVHAWAVEWDWDPSKLVSNAFEIEWPRGSGNVKSYPEVDKAAWFDVATARIKILAGQVGFIDELIACLEGGDGGSGSENVKADQLKLL